MLCILNREERHDSPSFHTDEKKDDMILKGFNTMICMLRGCGGVVLSTLILGCCCCHG